MLEGTAIILRLESEDLVVPVLRRVWLGLQGVRRGWELDVGRHLQGSRGRRRPWMPGAAMAGTGRGTEMQEAAA